VIDRRRPERQQVDAHLDDLQSEIEAGARTLDRIDREVSRVDRVIMAHLRQPEVTGVLMAQIDELKRSVAEQQATVQVLREEMRELRSPAGRGTREG
jgi:predicted RNase H-like nuclease (RuvC/YqgF family)